MDFFQLHNDLVPVSPVKHDFIAKLCFSCPIPVGGGSAPRSEHHSQSQKEESPRGAACQTQGVPAAEGETRGGQAEETEGGT